MCGVWCLRQVPNHALHRQVVQACPFNTDVSQLRGKLSWRRCLTTRAYVYTVHSSRCYLQPPSLGARLYLALTRLYSRQYVAAAKLLAGADSDLPITHEEAWVLRQFKGLAHDTHPDMHAFRIRLSLTLQFSPDAQNAKLPWDTQREMKAYLNKLQHTHVYCRVSTTQALTSGRLCPDQVTLLRSKKRGDTYTHLAQSTYVAIRV